MGSLWDAGRTAGGVRFDAAAAGSDLRAKSSADEVKDNSATNKAAVTKLLKELDDAQATGKNQTVQELRNKLNDMRKELGDEAFKALLEQLKKDAHESWLALLKRLFPDLFPDTPSTSPSPAAPSNTGRGGGGGGGASVSPGESMSNLPFTHGAQHHNYTPDKSNPGEKPRTERGAGNIWSGFSQSQGTGNCTTIAAIKAAMMQYGKKPTDVYKDVKAAGDGFDVQMRDGFQLHVSKAEVKQAAEQARFQGDNPQMMTNANFMYAVSAKRAQMEGNDGIAQQGFGAALHSLIDGEYLKEGLDRLGLKNNSRRTTTSELESGVTGVVSNGGHAMAVIGGRVEINGTRGSRPEDIVEAYALY